MTSNTPVLEVRNLKKYFSQTTSFLDSLRGKEEPPIQAVDNVSFTLGRNESIGVIGESGCGKTTLLETLMGLNEPTDGQILFKGRDISDFDRSDWKSFRRNVQIIFQDPFNSLDPKMTINETLLEPLKIHGIDDHDRRIRDVLERVELDPPERYRDRRPRQLSGGEKQRVSIARALILEPDLILADEPVSMLDVSTQAAVLNLLEDQIEQSDVSMLYISHDLSTVSYICQAIHVMYLGRFVESAPTNTLLSEPKHPYSQKLIEAIPIPDPHTNRERTQLEGAPQTPVNLNSGCRFRDRCPESMEVCGTRPDDVGLEADDQHEVACHLYYDHHGREDESLTTPPAVETNGRSVR
ncbi:ABC transporter ATP-binding protein [Haloferax sp. ATB1]|uniref:ABC transporter ATP-binding protein n=1 Tax=Haloferax sp. ATB1 TaxID=1508454 RepID=UPI000693255E|nr:ABC transporter ATP-binding protein [Haloferax sp. ATB1]